MSKLFIPYIMGNRDFIKNAKILSEQGADIIEIGIPFSDPVADGPIIMNAGQQAIKEGVTIDYIFNELAEHHHDIQSKYVLMTYYNIICHYGEEQFIKKCEDTGIYGLIIPDLPFELMQQLREKYNASNIKFIPLVAMTTNQQRINDIVNEAEGFIYTVTMNATTGENGQFHPELKQQLDYIRQIAQVPVVAGFGIRTKEHVADIASVADGVVVGSEIVKRFAEDSTEDTINYLKSIRSILDQV